MATLQEIADKIGASIPELEKLREEIELFATQQSFAIFIERTFTKGGVRDISGNLLKPYSEQYAKLRASGKLGTIYQTAVKDLQITGKLFHSIGPGVSNGVSAMGIDDSRSALIAGYQEEQNDTKIFQLSDAERAEVVKQTKEYYFKRLKEIIQQWH